MDLSDGLTKDLSRPVMSGVELGSTSEPCRSRVRSRAAPRSWAWMRGASRSGGEDYELLVTMPADGVGLVDELQTGFGVDLSELGEVTEGSGLIGVDAEGRETVLEAAGWDHFAGG